MASGPKFTSHERESKIAECSDLYLSGQSQNAIALTLGVSQQQVSAYLKKLQKRWQAQAAEAIDARKARELARLDRLEREHWAAWARSCQNAQTTVNRAKTTTVEAYTESGLIEMPALEREWTHTERGQVGDPRFLQGVKDCIELRLRIVGGLADKAIIIKTPEDKIVEYLRQGRLDPAEVRARFPNKAEAWFALAGIVVTQVADATG